MGCCGNEGLFIGFSREGCIGCCDNGGSVIGFSSDFGNEILSSLGKGGGSGGKYDIGGGRGSE